MKKSLPFRNFEPKILVNGEHFYKIMTKGTHLVNLIEQNKYMSPFNYSIIQYEFI